MKNKIHINQREVEYTLKVSNRARRMRLAIHGDGNFVVTAPYNLEPTLVEKFIIQKSRWIINKLDYFKKFKTIIISGSPKSAYLQHKNRALQLAQERVEYFNRIFNFQYSKISIRNQKTQWGSCSRKGNLSFNYKIALLPQELADYIIVHELCHLREFNHSKSFWNLVASVIPDYLAKRKELRRHKVRFL